MSALPPPPGRRPALAALAGVLAANGLAQTATRLSSVAIPWFVLAGSGGVRLTGLVTAAELAPYVLVKAAGGPLVDRIGGRRVSVWGDLVSAAAAGAVSLAHALGALHWPLLFTLVALLGAARGPGDTAKEVLVPAAAGRAGVRIERATGLLGTVSRIALVAGPAAAGALIALFGAPNALLATAALFAFGAVLVPLSAPRQHTDGEPSSAVPAQPVRYREQMAAGWDFLRSDRLLRAIVGMVAVTNLLDSAMISVLLPAWTRAHGGSAAQLGLLSSVAGLTSVAGSLLMTLFGARLPQRLVLVAGFGLGGAPRFAVLAAGVPPWAVAAVFGCAGLGAGALNPLFGTLLYQRVPDRLYGRVMATVDAGCWVGVPLGGLAGGLAASAAGLPGALALGAAGYLAATLLPVLRPRFRELDRPALRRRLRPGTQLPE